MASGLVSDLTTDELAPLLDDLDDLFLLDVRTPEEFADWSIDVAHNVPIDELAVRLNEVPTDRHVAVMCASGTRARQGAEILATRGQSSSVVVGGMHAWADTYDSVAGEIGGATVVQVRRRGKGCLSYVVGAGDTCVVIDPSREIDRYRDIADARGWRVTHVMDTHLHADHLSGARSLSASTGAALWLNPADPFAFDFEPLVDGRSVTLAEGVELTVSAVSVPGHTEGSTMYQLGTSAVFTGDTLFLESVGRPDLADQAEAFAHRLYQSLHVRILPMSDDVLVFPAHYGAGVEVRSRAYVTRQLGELRATLPALSLDEDGFVAWAVERVTDRPPNYKRIVSINAGLEAAGADAGDLEAGPNRCAIA
ncbi:MAG TPA: MBL fold metallo-hydrolase [Acidimicrobiales bacterium]|nr:MBL fold metallo-hydrolase [Acidimicrobiales bacterium]